MNPKCRAGLGQGKGRHLPWGSREGRGPDEDERRGMKSVLNEVLVCSLKRRKRSDEVAGGGGLGRLEERWQQGGWEGSASGVEDLSLRICCDTDMLLWATVYPTSILSKTIFFLSNNTEPWRRSTETWRQDWLRIGAFQVLIMEDYRQEDQEWWNRKEWCHLVLIRPWGKIAGQGLEFSKSWKTWCGEDLQGPQNNTPLFLFWAWTNLCKQMQEPGQ